MFQTTSLNIFIFAENSEELRKQIAQMQWQLINIAKVTNSTHEMVSKNRQDVLSRELEERRIDKPIFPVLTVEDVELMDQKMITDSKFEAKVVNIFGNYHHS